MHYLLLISPTTEMLFRTELLIRSIEKFTPPGLPCYFTAIVNGDHRVDQYEKIKLDRTTVANEYINSKVELFYCPYYWSVPYPSRWFVEPKADTCVFIDVDVIATSNLLSLYNLPRGMIHGVTVLKNNHISKDQWNAIGFTEEDLKYYFNFGMLVVPSKYLEMIGDAMMVNLPKIMPLRDYFGAQIAMAYTIKELGLPRNVLPRNFNWYNVAPCENEVILFYHFIFNKLSSLNEARSYNGNCSSLVRSVVNELYPPKKLFV